MDPITPSVKRRLDAMMREYDRPTLQSLFQLVRTVADKIDPEDELTMADFFDQLSAAIDCERSMEIVGLLKELGDVAKLLLTQQDEKLS